MACEVWSSDMMKIMFGRWAVWPIWSVRANAANKRNFFMNKYWNQLPEVFSHMEDHNFDKNPGTILTVFINTRKNALQTIANKTKLWMSGMSCVIPIQPKGLKWSIW
jgi:hypothetical protein